MPIYCDNREPVEILERLKYKHLAVEVKYLESGDYVFGEVGIERKTISDLIDSIYDKRLWSQLDTLRRTYKIPILLIEGWGGLEKLDKFTQGVLTTLLLFWKQSIIFSYDWRETSKWVEVLFLKHGIGKSNRTPPAVVKKHKNIKDIRLEMLQCIQGIGPVTAKKILEAVPDVFSALHDSIDLNKLLKSIKGLNKESCSLLVKVKSRDS